ncbi:alpha/beta hydrolase [Streptomyces sp. 549]|uniref:alpha/beta hydrolase n=1 Tax=Streptomyces sp. 549 TaxID=3049076 RepID=UPI0024C23D02|nr:alpha/beta hydrolase [Streptomyces sp. 549]MDK1473965.1 alpha/beta hydrolase [Streptomyces sp. 549]
MVLVLLATTGWTALQNQHAKPEPRAVALTAWQKDTLGGRPLPAADADPRAVSRFFGKLDQRRQMTLAERHPLVVGNMNGAPLPLRYRANRVALTEAVHVERVRRNDERLSETGRQDAGRRMNRFLSMLRDGRQILAFDPSGRGRAAEVFGDLGTARRVSVVVPGVDTELLTFERTQQRYSAPVGMAQALHRSERAARPGLPSATIAWADYRAPRGVGVDAATGGLAEQGAQRLNALLRALPGGSTVALMCHSYGSVLCGVAGREAPARVTDIAVAGSPGMRAEQVSELGTRARVWAMRAEHDWIADVPHLEFGGLGHGTDPVSPGFGARRLSTEGATGHTGYFRPGSGSLRNLAAIGTGDYTLTTRL